MLNTMVTRAGINVIVTNEENSKPNSTIAPKPRYSSVPAPGCNTSGDKPNTVVVVDITIGRSRERVASRTASILLMPAFKLRKDFSTNNIGLFTTVPIKTTKPSMVMTSNGCWIPGKPSLGNSAPIKFNSHNPTIPPLMPSGTVSIINNGYAQCENMATSNR